MADDILQTEIDNLHTKLVNENTKRGYYLNPDESFTKSLIEGLLVNEKRYGYQVCPCRLASGERDQDRDIICPCDYRDADVAQYGTCYCGLYVAKKKYETRKPINTIPERRPRRSERLKINNMTDKNIKDKIGELKYPVWRCDVCGYICARDEAPDVCPICGVTRDRFSRFI